MEKSATAHFSAMGQTTCGAGVRVAGMPAVGLAEGDSVTGIRLCVYVEVFEWEGSESVWFSSRVRMQVLGS